MNVNQLLSKELLQTIPPLYANESISLQDVVIRVKFFLGNFTWLVTECEVQDNYILFFGYVINHSNPDFSEWGYFSFSEIRKLCLKGPISVERALCFKPCRFADYKINN